MKSTLSYAIMVLQKNFVSFSNRELQKLGLSQGLLYFILYVGNHPGCSQKELAQRLHMDAGHVTRSLNKLEQNGFITMEQNKEDRRVHMLYLQKKGEEAFLFSHSLFSRWDQAVLSEMTEADQQQLLSYTSQLARKIGGNHHA